MKSCYDGTEARRIEFEAERGVSNHDGEPVPDEVTPLRQGTRGLLWGFNILDPPLVGPRTMMVHRGPLKVREREAGPYLTKPREGTRSCPSTSSVSVLASLELEVDPTSSSSSASHELELMREGAPRHSEGNEDRVDLSLRESR